MSLLLRHSLHGSLRCSRDPIYSQQGRTQGDRVRCDVLLPTATAGCVQMKRGCRHHRQEERQRNCLEVKLLLEAKRKWRWTHDNKISWWIWNALVLQCPTTEALFSCCLSLPSSMQRNQLQPLDRLSTYIDKTGFKLQLICILWKHCVIS